jgi:anti-sigma factor RsiW
MEVTRKVILDLLPMYLAGEVSPDTQKLVELYLETDPELAQKVRKVNVMKLESDTPIPFEKEDQMEAYKEAQKMITQRTIIWGSIAALVIISGLGLALLVYFMMVPVM